MLPPLVNSVVLGLPVPSVSPTEETEKVDLQTRSVPSDHCSSFLSHWNEMQSWESVLAACWFLSPSLHQQPPLGDSKLLSSFWRETHRPPLYHKTLLFWSPSERLSPHPQSDVPTSESAVEKKKQCQPRRLPTLLCCYSNSSKEAAVRQPRRNPHVLICTRPRPRRTNALRRRKSEHNQPVCVLFSRPVRLAGLAVIVIESLTGWSSVSTLPQNCSLLSGDRGI